MQKPEWGKALSRSRQAAFGRLASLLGKSELTHEFWDSLTEALIGADLGAQLAAELVKVLRETSASEGMTRGAQVGQELRRRLLGSLLPTPPTYHGAFPLAILMAGVNGSGKTSSAAKLAAWWQAQGRRPLLAAADTFRAAAGEQLATWGERLGIEVIGGSPGSDPGAVTHRACQAAISGMAEVVIVDTSGRMHTSHNLMQELAKIERVIGKLIEGGPQLGYLVLDATTGQNGLRQAEVFAESVRLTGVILAKLDSSAKGGVGFAVQQRLSLPICYVGTGEAIGDWAPFEPERFVEGLLQESTRASSTPEAPGLRG